MARQKTQAQEAKIRAAVLEHYSEYEERFGIGPCGVIADLLQRLGFGKLACCFCYEKGTPHTYYSAIPHFVNLRPDGSVFDASVPLQIESYEEIEACPEGLPRSGPSALWGKEDYAYWTPILRGNYILDSQTIENTPNKVANSLTILLDKRRGVMYNVSMMSKIKIVHFTPTEQPLVFKTDSGESVICVYKLTEIDLRERQQAWAGRNPLFACVDGSVLTLLQDDPSGEGNDEYTIPASLPVSWRNEI